MLTLYGDLDSGNVYKVRLLLAQLGIAYRRVDTTQNRGETATVEFRAINPIGKIPTIVFDDGRMLPESGAILYLLARVPRCFRPTPGIRRTYSGSISLSGRMGRSPIARSRSAFSIPAPKRAPSPLAEHINPVSR